MPSADQVPIKTPHSTMRWHLWVVLIAGSTDSALRAVRPPNFRITPVGRRNRVHSARDGFLVALTPCHHGPSHPRDLVGKRELGPRAQDRLGIARFLELLREIGGRGQRERPRSTATPIDPDSGRDWRIAA